MSRHQYRHGPTLDALQLRGGTYVKAETVREGDYVLSLDSRHDFEVAGWELSEDGIALLGTMGEVRDCYVGEYVCVIRGTIETVPLPRSRT